MTLKHLAIFFLMVAVASAGCKKDEAADPGPGPSAQGIIPGVGITNLKIGDKAQVAIDLYGPPFPSNASSGGMYTHYLVYTSKGVVIYCEPTTEATFNAQMPVASLKLSAPFAEKTDKGIAIGSTKAAVKAAYGDPISSGASGDKYAIGISFVYDTQDKVTSIKVE